MVAHLIEISQDNYQINFIDIFFKDVKFRSLGRNHGPVTDTSSKVSLNAFRDFVPKLLSSFNGANTMDLFSFPS